MNQIIETPVGGIMTREVGAITGPVEVAVADGNADAAVTVRYEGAAEWYTVQGSPVTGVGAEVVVAHLTRDPGAGTDGNPASTDLSDLR